MKNKSPILFLLAILLICASVISYTLLRTDIDQKPVAGATYSVGGVPYYLYGAGIGSSDTSITLTSFKQPTSGYLLNMSDFGSTGYLTIQPGNVNYQEFVSFTGVTQNSDGTATLTGVTRGLAPVSPYTASSTLQKAHSGGTTAIISNPPQFYERFANKDNDQSITGTWTFASTSAPAYDATYTASGNEFVSFTQLNSIAIAGGATSTEGVLGYVALNQASNLADGTASTSSGAPLVIQNKFATTTPGSLCTGGTWNCIVATVNGVISTSYTWFNGLLAAANTWTGSNAFNATTTISASGLSSAPVIFNSVSYKFPSAQGGMFSVIRNDGSGNLSWGGSPRLNYATSTAIISNNGFATSTALVVPAGVMTASSTILFQAGINPAASATCSYFLSTSEGTRIASSTVSASSANQFLGSLSGMVFMNNAVSSQVGHTQIYAGNNGVINAAVGFSSGSTDITSSVDFSSQQSLVAVVQSKSANNCTLSDFFMTISP